MAKQHQKSGLLSRNDLLPPLKKEVSTFLKEDQLKDLLSHSKYMGGYFVLPKKTKGNET
jgi:hypothetical protein